MVYIRTYRDYINDTGRDVAVQAGPNGPENVHCIHSLRTQYWVLTIHFQNHDLAFAISRDLGRTWQNNWEQHISNLAEDAPILPTAAGITVFSIPKYGWVHRFLGEEAWY